MKVRQYKRGRRLNTAIKYEVREFIHGRTDYITDCPFGERGRYTNLVNKVGALECNISLYQQKKNALKRQQTAL